MELAAADCKPHDLNHHHHLGNHMMPSASSRQSPIGTCTGPVDYGFGPVAPVFGVGGLGLSPNLGTDAQLRAPALAVGVEFYFSLFRI